MAQTITAANVQLGIRASASPQNPNVAGAASIGAQLHRKSFTDCDIAYVFKVAAAAASNVATLTLASGAVATTTGSPVITDAATDFEGLALATMATHYGILIECLTADTITVGGTAGFAGVLAVAGDQILQLHGTGDTGLGTVTLTFTTGNGVAQITVIGKS
jgi:hypothetical protein